jgi:hypothetical protein
VTALPYPVLSSVIEPGDNDPATRLMGRITAGTGYAREMDYSEMMVCLTRADFALYALANEGLPNALPLDQSVCDGAKVSQMLDGGVSYFQGRDRQGKRLTFPLMSDAQYVASFTLVAGMFVVREGDLEPRELVRDPLTPGVLRVGLHRYDTKGRAVKRKAPAILYAWDKDVMEAKAEAGRLTVMEKTLFSSLFDYKMTYLESLTSVHQ